MRKKFSTNYPNDWPEIAKKVKEECGNRCERCGHENDPEHGYTLTVHHLDGNGANCARWNLAGLCQRCHLHIQGKVNLSQFWMFEHSAWMKPHVEGYYRSVQEKIKKQMKNYCEAVK